MKITVIIGTHTETITSTKLADTAYYYKFKLVDKYPNRKIYTLKPRGYYGR